MLKLEMSVLMHIKTSLSIKNKRATLKPYVAWDYHPISNKIATKSYKKGVITSYKDLKVLKTLMMLS